MSKFEMLETVRFKKQSGLFVISGVDGQTTYSITNKNQYDAWNPEDTTTAPKTIFHNVKEKDLKKGFK